MLRKWQMLLPMISLKQIFSVLSRKGGTLFVLCVYACLACACSSTEEELPRNVQRASPESFSFSQKKLIDIIKEQEKFIARVKEHANMPRHELLSTANRINSLWIGYVGDNPNDAEALIIYSKFMRFIGDTERAYATAKDASQKAPTMPSAWEQMAAYEAENGMYAQAYKNINKAVELNPNVAVYYKQKAQIIIVFREKMISENFATQDKLDAELMDCRQKVCNLLPNDVREKMAYAQTFYEVRKADWNKALVLWKEIEASCGLNLDLQIVHANIARVLIELGRDAEAEKILESVTLPALQDAKRILLEEIARAKNAPLPNQNTSARFLNSPKIFINAN